MCGSEDWPNFANERRLLLCLLDECALTQCKPGKSWFVPVLLFLIHLAMTSKCKHTAWFFRLTGHCAPVRLLFVRNWGGFRPASEWNLCQNPDGSTCRRLGNGRNESKTKISALVRWKNEMNGPFLHGTSELEIQKHNCSWILLLKMTLLRGKTDCRGTRRAELVLGILRAFNQLRTLQLDALSGGSALCSALLAALASFLWLSPLLLRCALLYATERSAARTEKPHFLGRNLSN